VKITSDYIFKCIFAIMQTVFYPASEHGYANHGWLVANHSFSFANWQDQSKMNFGALRVLNDDIIAAGMGFGAHPHSNMEIITLVQQGALAHKDSMGNGATMYANEVQVMSAGSGVTHSEYNASATEELKLFQIWLFPNQQNVTPRYDQKNFNAEQRKNQWQEIIKPNTQSEGDALFIYQNAWFNLADLEVEKNILYTSKNKNNGAYIFVIEGSILVNDLELNKRDAIGIMDYESIVITASTDASVLLMDVPMEF
jgi:quercetin 2,3-dioxygenase